MRMSRLSLAVGSILMLLALAGTAQAQTFDVEPDTFALELKTWMEQSPKAYAKETANTFYTAWTSGAFAGREDSVRATTQLMVNKGYRPYDQIADWLQVITLGASHPLVQGPQYDSLIHMVDQTARYYDGTQLRQSLRTVKGYLETDALYSINFNRLHAFDAQIKFRFVAPYVDTYSDEVFYEEVEDTGDTGDDVWGEWDNEEEQDTEWNSDWNSWDTEDSNSGWDDGSQADVTSGEDDGALIDALNDVSGPPLEGPILRFDAVTLVMATRWDSVAIQEAAGDLMLINETFVGTQGKVDWTSTGLPPEAYVELGNYNFKITLPEMSADGVTMHYEGYLQQPVEGIFDFQSRRHDSPQTARYPRFMSYNADAVLISLGDDILTYRGGFGLEGATPNSSSVFEGFALLEATDTSGRLFRAKARRFNFEGDDIITRRASFSIYTGIDSIHHPAVRLRYNLPGRQLTIQQSEGGFKNYPFYASYYNMDFYADIISWNLNADSLDISILNARDQVPAVFESTDYFNEEQFNSLVGMYGFHPLLIITSYARKVRSNTFLVSDAVQGTPIKPGQLDAAMKFVRERGFVDYDPVSQEITIRDKTWHFVGSKFKKKDYDNIYIPSVSPGKPNATLNRHSKEITLRGIPEFYISRELEAYIRPRNQEITLLKNRDFKFNGELNVGNFEFVGEEFTFKYDSFLVELVSIDSIRFYVEVVGPNGEVRKQLIDNELVGISQDEQGQEGIEMDVSATSGTIYINRPDNKSGDRVYPEYPIFDASKGAVVYFDDESVLDGAYDKSMYYVIPPFKIDSLADSDPGAISFPGTFYSNGMLPPIQEKLVVTADNILGFRHTAPPEGLPLYDGKARVYNELVMDRNGLQAEGSIDYLSAHLESSKFTFYPDSAITKIGEVARIAPGDLDGVSYPQAEVYNYTMQWYPGADRMKISNNGNPIEFYQASATLDGETTVSPEGAFGKGTLLTRGSETRSEEYTFTEDAYGARHAYFEVKSDNPRKPAVLGQDVRLDFQLTGNYADISPEQEGVAAIGFPYAQYKTSIPAARWSLDDNRIVMTKPADVPVENSYFYSTRRAQDSLAFLATSAEYIIDSLKMRVGGIPYITVADAFIIPYNNQVTIRQNAQIEKLTEARLVIDTLNEYHSLFNGTIDIESRTKFYGDATYELVNSAADTFAIKFDRFQLVENENARRGDKPFNTVSSGTVTEDDNIIISPGMIYRGRATMYADKPALELRGLVKLDFKTIENYDTWIRYSSSAESQKVVFDYATSVTDLGQPLHAGIHFDRRTGSLYHTFVTDKNASNDPDFFEPSGNLYYDENTYEFVIADPLKDTSDAWAGKMFRFNENTRIIDFEGAVNLVQNEENFPVQSAGKGTVVLDSSKIHMNAFLTMDMDIPKNIQYLMGEDLLEVIELLGAPESARDPVAMMYLLAEIIGEEDTRYYDESIMQEYTPMVQASRDLEKTLVLNDVDLEWSEEQKAFFSRGSRMGLSNVQNLDINAGVEGFLEIRKTLTGDQVNLFIKAAPESWYYFQYADNRLGIFSSNEVVNAEVSGNSNALKAKPGEFIFYQADVAETLAFINRFRQTYQNNYEPYRLDDPVAGMDMPVTTEDSGFPGADEEEDDDGF